MSVLTLIKRHPVVTYFILAFIISWGSMLIVVGPGGFPCTPEEIESLMPAVILAVLAGPSISGIVMTGLISGRAGFRQLLLRLLRWRAGIAWYAAALLIAPILMTAIPLALSLKLPEFLPGIITKSDKSSLLIMGIIAGLMAGIFEELGWTGFAIPRLRLKFSVLSTGLIVGFLWGAWHYIINYWSSGTPTGTLAIDLFMHSIIFSIGILSAFRVLMVWVYDSTESLLLVILMHMSLTSSNVIFVPQVITGATGPIWSLSIAAAMWIVVAVVAAASGGRLLRQPNGSR
jgi:membrane protease YdiL (CAAX protease family)